MRSLLGFVLFLQVAGCSPNDGTPTQGGESTGAVVEPTTPTTPTTPTAKGDRIVLHEESVIGYDNAAHQEEHPYLLRPNGDFFRGLTMDPGQIEATKTARPDLWGTWADGGGPDEIVVTFSSGKQATWTVSQTTPGTPGEVLSGTYYTIDYGDPAAHLLPSVNGFSVDGDRYAFGAGTTGVVTVERTSFTSPTHAGTFEIDGYSITMHRNDGTTEKSFFYHRDNRKDWFGIGESSYWPNRR